MLAWFRRQRLLAALLIAANPALVGSWVAAHHPCPVRDGALGRWGAAAVESQAPAISEHAGHEMMMMEEAPAPSEHPPGHDHSGPAGPCTCIGQCLSATVALAPDAGRELRVAFVLTPHFAPRTSHVVAAWTTTPLDLLPPSTAPPIA
ncbi:MAG TPA: hypothetical protein VG712_01130 [Gemmatimonadales bacterium]|nr:hypothetical protein [Gemmatimonadales bacterium]